jgi:hypothetical protein
MIWQAFEKERHRDAEDFGNLMETARPDAISALFVFLHLLECYPKGLTKFTLAHVKHESSHTNPLSNVHIDGAWCCLWHVLKIPRFVISNVAMSPLYHKGQATWRG